MRAVRWADMTVDCWAARMVEPWVACWVDQKVDYWADRMAVHLADRSGATKAGLTAARSAANLAGPRVGPKADWRAVSLVPRKAGRWAASRADCWAGHLVVQRAEPRAALWDGLTVASSVVYLVVYSARTTVVSMADPMGQNSAAMRGATWAASKVRRQVAQ